MFSIRIGFRSLMAAIAVLAISGGGVSAADRHAETIDGVLAQLRGFYTFPEVAKAMEASVRAKQAAGEYDGLDEGAQIAERLSADLQAVSKDGHIVVRYSEPPLPEERPGEELDTAGLRAMITSLFAAENYGSERVEVLPGMIGYYKVNVLVDPHFARERHAAAMSLLSSTRALILDFRDNRGAMGDGAVEELASYFLPGGTHLADLWWRESDRTERSQTHDDIPGPAYRDRPVYVLTSRFSFSGAEAFASQLQAHRRVTVVGERSGGGANPGQPRRATAHYSVFVPNGLVTNAITGGNWEGIGVTPDVAVPAQKAPLVAQTLALDALLAATSESDATDRARLEEARTVVARKLAQFKPIEFALAGHAEAKDVRVAADFNHWRGAAFVLTRDGDRWVGHAELAPGSYRYRFEVDGAAMPDPSNPHQERRGARMNSVLTVD